MKSFPLSRQIVPAAALFVAIVFTLVGCSGGVGTVSGKVTFKDAPLKGGNVTFAPASGQGPSFTGPINEDGTYSVTGVPADEYKVCVETEFLKGAAASGTGGKSTPPSVGGSSVAIGAGVPDLSKVKDKSAGKNEMPEGYAGDGLAKIKDNAKRYVKIPGDYATPATSDISVKVTGGSQTFDIPLKAK